MKKLMLLFIAVIITTLLGQDITANRPFRKINNQAYSYGEKLTYRMHYGIINAGYATLEIDPTTKVTNGRNAYHITCFGKSSKAMDVFFSVRDKFETYLDEEAIFPHKFIKNQREGGYKSTDFVLFNHQRNMAYSKKGGKEIPPYAQDLVSVVYYMRNMDFSNAKKGDTYPFTFYYDNEVYNFKLKILGREKVKTDVGKFNAIKIRPQIIADRVFKDEESMTVWISDDANKIPLKIQSELLIGSAKATLKSYSGLRNPAKAKIK